MAPAASKCLHGTVPSRKDVLKMYGVDSKIIWDVHGTIVTVHSAVLDGTAAEVVEKSWDSQRTWECAGARQVGNEMNLSFSGAVQHGLIVTPFEAVITKSHGCHVYYPYAGKNLADHFAYVRSVASLDQLVLEVKRMLVQLLLALADVHNEDCVLMDLKDTNTLYDAASMVYRLSDVGLCARTGSRQGGKDASRPCADMEKRADDGTRVSDCPELRRLANMPAADILALAEMVYQFLIGCRPACIDLGCIEAYIGEIPGHSKEQLLAMTEELREYILTGAMRDRCADMVHKGYWQVLLKEDIAPIDADLADMLGQMMRPASDRPSADKLLGHKAIKGMVAEEVAHLKAALPAWEARNEAAAQLASIVQHANRSEALRQQMQHSKGFKPLWAERMPADHSSSGISTPDSHNSSSSSNAGSPTRSNNAEGEVGGGSNAQDTLSGGSNAQMAALGGSNAVALERLVIASLAAGVSCDSAIAVLTSSGAPQRQQEEQQLEQGWLSSVRCSAGASSSSKDGPCTPDCRYSIGKSPFLPVACNSDSQDTPFLPVVTSSTQEDALPAGEHYSSSEPDSFNSSSEEGPATPGGSHIGSDNNALLPCADSSNSNQKEPFASGPIISSVGTTEELPMPPIVNQQTLCDSSGAADCAPGQDQAALEPDTAQGSSDSNTRKGDGSNSYNPSNAGGPSRGTGSYPSNSKLKPLATALTRSGSSSLTSHPLEMDCCDHTQAEVTVAGVAARIDSSLSCHPFIGCDDTASSSPVASHPLEMDCCEDTTVETMTTGATAAADSSSSCSSVLVGKVAAGVTGWASCRRLGVIRGVRRLSRV